MSHGQSGRALLQGHTPCVGGLGSQLPSVVWSPRLEFPALLTIQPPQPWDSETHLLPTGFGRKHSSVQVTIAPVCSQRPGLYAILSGSAHDLSVTSFNPAEG